MAVKSFPLGRLAARARGVRWLLLLLWLASLGGLSARAALQFDVFLGYDGIVPEASWFPVVCEVKNDGPSFTAVVEVGLADDRYSQPRRMVVELPTGTLKRFVIPVFSSSGYSSWDVRLLDERGKTRAEQLRLNPRKKIPRETRLMGALPRNAGGTPTIRPIQAQQSGQQSDLQPMVARFQAPIFPDNPLVLEGMDALYLNSEKAPELRVNQVRALQAWLYDGGHLIVGVEQITDINSSPWLKGLFPCDLTGMRALPRHSELQEWLRTASAETSFNLRTRQSGGRNRSSSTPAIVPGNPFSDLANDPAFETAELQVATGTVRDGEIVVATEDQPLIVTAHRGRGRITALLFSPEREPVRSWKHLPTFWAKLAEVPALLYTASDFVRQGGWSSDGIFGAMIDSKQVHKLPIEWLLLLLIVYLVVIGPLDQYWLKRIGKPMLTWITFPCYVVLFSLLIYFIGYKLRAGESEWNELHLVDVVASGEQAELRGRTYVSVYSPANQKFALESQQRFATFRGEFMGSWGGAPTTEKSTVMQSGDNFKAEIFVPVWTSQLFVTDWWQQGAVPVNVIVEPQEGGWKLKVQNRSERKLTNLHIAFDGVMLPLGDLPPNQTSVFNVAKEKGLPLRDFVFRYGSTFQNAVQSRQHAFGASESGRLGDLPNGSIAASLVSQLVRQNNPNSYSAMSFLAPPGLDVSGTVERGTAMLFAWDDGYSPSKPLHQFSPRRLHRDTLWRVALALK